MKTNKIIIAVVLIIIVAAISWISFSKKNPTDVATNGSSTGEIRNEDSGSTNNDTTNNNKVVDLNCAQPKVTVLSPNGGQSYKNTETVTFKWRTCGVASKAHLTGELIGVSNPSDSKVLFGLADDQKIVKDTKSLNDGQITINLGTIAPTDPQWIKPGTYKFKVSVIDYSGIYDLSDTTFTISK